MSAHTALIAFLAVSLLCWGSWANLHKSPEKWRYPPFYCDFSIGVALVAMAFLLGAATSGDLTFRDDLLTASSQKIIYVFLGGAAFNLSSVLLIAGLSVAPISIVFLGTVGVGLVAEAARAPFPSQVGVSLFLSGGAMVLAAALGTAFAHHGHRRQGTRWQLAPELARGIVLSALSGIVMASVPALLNRARAGDDGLGGSSVVFLLGFATLLSTCFYAPFFFAFAVHGEPVPWRRYFKGSMRQHLSGLLSGGLWSAALIAGLLWRGPLTKLEAGAAVLAMLWGALAWREFSGSDLRLRMRLTSMLILWTVGASMLVLAHNQDSWSTLSEPAALYEPIHLDPILLPWPDSQAVATHADFSYAVRNGTFTGLTTTPAKPGETIILWGTGLGPTAPELPEGAVVPEDRIYATRTPPTVFIDRIQATVYSAALAPGYVGLYQVAIQVPPALGNGIWPIAVAIGGVKSPRGTVLAVQR